MSIWWVCALSGMGGRSMKMLDEISGKGWSPTTNSERLVLEVVDSAEETERIGFVST